MNDPNNPSVALVHCEIDHDDEAAGLAAAREAAKAAYRAVNPGKQPPATREFTLPGRLTHTMVELGN
jgi:hypothetical protein